MYDPQGFADLQDNVGFDDSSSWLISGGAENQNQSSFVDSSAAGSSSGNGNLDPRLIKDLVEMMPLIEHLMDQKERSSFTRRGSMIYTKTPSRESRKAPDTKGRIPCQSLPTRKKKDQNCKSNVDPEREVSANPSKDLEAEKQELVSLREQVKDLEKMLAEKDELLKSTETSKTQVVSDLHSKLDELKHSTAEKDSMIRSMQLQLSDLKIKLADKQAILEKMEWEAATSGNKAEKIQEQLDAARREISFFMHFFEGVKQNDSQSCHTDYDAKPYQFETIPYLDDMNETDFQKMEEARNAYVAALAAAKERRDEESLAVAVRARTYLQSFVFQTPNINCISGVSSV